MKKLLFIVCMAMFSIGSFAQVKGDKAVGAQLSYGTDAEKFAVGVRGMYNVTDPIRIGAEINYWLIDHATCLDFQANANYLFSMSDNLKLYPLAGLGYSYAKPKGGDGNGDIFFNLGGGIQYDFTQKMSIFGELKYQFKEHGQFVIGGGIAFKL